MSVLIEAITVVVKNETLTAEWRSTFVANVPNLTFRTDGIISAVSFMAPDAVKKFIDSLERVGMVFIENDTAKNIAVIDQHTGPTAHCDWLSFEKIKNGYSFVWLTGHPKGEIAVYENWTPDIDLKFREGGKTDNLKFLKQQDGLDVYLDLDDGKEYFIARSDL